MSFSYLDIVGRCFNSRFNIFNWNRILILQPKVYANKIMQNTLMNEPRMNQASTRYVDAFYVFHCLWTEWLFDDILK